MSPYVHICIHLKSQDNEDVNTTCMNKYIIATFLRYSNRRHFPAMYGDCKFLSLFAAAALLLLVVVVPPPSTVSAQSTSSRWQTLSGNAPLVIARGGFSGLFADSSDVSYTYAIATSLPNVVLWCDVQLTKDGIGICAPDVNLANCTNIAQVFTDKSEYLSVDFAYSNLSNITLIQSIYSRSPNFDVNFFPILTVEEVSALKPKGLWLNIQNDAFYTRHNLSMRNYVLSLSKRVVFHYISSPEEAFLRGISSRLNQNVTKLVFRFMEEKQIDPSTNRKYGSLRANLTSIKAFASGILVPKTYIWPTDQNMYLQPHTSLVSDAHKAGLEVFAYEFYNDAVLSYDYSYDPITEYLNFIDNGDFSVDGVLSDFPVSPSAAIDCFAHLGGNASKQVDLLVISKNGASGDYPDCSDLAYSKAISDGADVIDCPVQISKDGVPFCSGFISLINHTNVASTKFKNLVQTIPELVPQNGVFTFNLTWGEIQTLNLVISSPYREYELLRNPNFQYAGKLLRLSDFLILARNVSSLLGIVIKIENAAYLIEKQKLPVVDKVVEALSEGGYDNQTGLKVMIQSSSSSVLKKFKDEKKYELVYEVDESIRDAFDSTIENIKEFANYVVIRKKSVFPTSKSFVITSTNVVSRLQSFKIPVFVETFRNEFMSQAWDYLSDATVEINTFVKSANVSGVITEFPKTSARYKRNRCLSRNPLPSYMTPIPTGNLLGLITPDSMPPALAPSPVLTDDDVREPPLPSVTVQSLSPTPGGGAASPSTSPRNSQHSIAVSMFASNLAVVVSILALCS